MQSLRCHRLYATFALALLLVLPGAHAVVFFNTSDPNYNTTAPTGDFVNSGWQYEGVFGDNLGTAIAPQYFITAAHVPAEATFTRLGLFTGGVDISYAVDTAAFSGAGFYTVAGTDLRVYKITGTFDTWAELYTGNSEAGALATVHGKGGERGGEIYLGADLKGWYGTGTNRVPRWGTNEITGIVPDAFSPVGDLLVADFNALGGVNEAMLTGNDSGGGLFINDGGTWRLAGINYAVDGTFNTTPSDTGAFNGALFDIGGYYVGQGTSWDFIPDGTTDVPQSLYASRISTYADQLKSVTGVPEPGSALLLVTVLVFGSIRRRNRVNNRM
jgi:hypothetical protein